MANGGIIGPVNIKSRGKNTITSKTSSGCVSLQSGTRLVDAAVIAGGGGGESGGGGAGGLRQFSNLPASSFYTVQRIGAGGSAGAVGVDSLLQLEEHLYC